MASLDCVFCWQGGGGDHRKSLFLIGESPQQVLIFWYHKTDTNPNASEVRFIPHHLQRRVERPSDAAGG